MLLKITDEYMKSLLKRKDFPPEKGYEIRDEDLNGMVLIVRPSGVLSFCVRYRNAEGKAKKFTIGRYGGKVTVSEARKIAKKKLGAVAAGSDVQLEKKLTRERGKKADRSTVRFFIDNKYRDWVVTERKTGHMIMNRIESNFSEWFGDALSEISVWNVTKWRSSRIKDGIKPSTVNRDINAIKAMLSKAVEWGDLEYNPLFKLKPLRVDKSGVIRYLTSPEEKRLRTALDKRQDSQRAERVRFNRWRSMRGKAPYPDLSELAYSDYLKPMVLVCLNTGMRRGEIFALKHSDVDYKQRSVTIRGSVAKSGNTRHIPLNKEAFGILKAWCDQITHESGDLVFPSPVSGRQFDNIRKSWKALTELAEIKNFRFPDLRHTFASKLVMAGVDLYTVKELLGHANIETTQRYAHLSPEHKAKAVELLHDGRKS